VEISAGVRWNGGGKHIREALITGLLGDGQGFTSKRGLVDRNVDSLGETAVGGNDVTNFEGDHVTGDEVGGFDFLPLTVTLDLGFGGERVHKGLDSVTSVALFVETDGRVGEEEENDTDKVGPVRRLALTVGESDSDEGGSFHDPGERIPHEREELQAS
jgi:hypothetical protein